jgi:serine/threonine-protein kinase
MARDLAEVLSFGRYEPLFRVGLGGMAEVYAARIRGEAGFQKLVAIKRMLPHLITDQKFVDMFLDEARLAANVQSPHVVSTLDLGRSDDGSLYLVMELIIGVTLGQIIVFQSEQQKYIDPFLALEIVAQAAQGLDDAHASRSPSGKSLGLVHRDVSPQNILIGIDGRVRVTDFGIAHALHLRRTQTQVGEMKGKFSYFSPEQAGGGSIDGRSDIFSLGICAWELITGRRLFKGKMLDAIDAVKTREIVEPHAVRPELHEKISQVVMKALERDRDRRYSTAGEFATALRRAIVELSDPPTPRKLGQLVIEVGGERLDRIHECIARADGTVNTTTGVALVSSTSTAKVSDVPTANVGLHDHATHLVEAPGTERPTRPSGRFPHAETTDVGDRPSHDPPTVLIIPQGEAAHDTPEDADFDSVPQSGVLWTPGGVHDVPTVNQRPTNPDVLPDDATVLDDRYRRVGDDNLDAATIADHGAVARLRRAGLVPPNASDRTVLLGAVGLGFALVVSFGVGIALALSSGPGPSDEERPVQSPDESTEEAPPPSAPAEPPAPRGAAEAPSEPPVEPPIENAAEPTPAVAIEAAEASVVPDPRRRTRRERANNVTEMQTSRLPMW